MATTTSRLIDLMILLEWKGRKDWDLLSKDEREKEILPFLAWVKEHLPYVEPARIRELMEGNLLRGEVGNVRQNYYKYIDAGKGALASIYKYSRANHRLLNTLHDRAMEYADHADELQKMGEIELAKKMFQRAFHLEEYVAQRTSEQPSVSVLCRSAAWLGYHAGYYDDAFLIAMRPAEIGHVPPELDKELNEVIAMCRREIRYAQKNNGHHQDGR